MTRSEQLQLESSCFFFTEFLLVSLFSERPTNLSAKPTDLKTVLTLQ